jgi:hypothetical protein
MSIGTEDSLFLKIQRSIMIFQKSLISCFLRFKNIDYLLIWYTSLPIKNDNSIVIMNNKFLLLLLLLTDLIQIEK